MLRKNAIRINDSTVVGSLCYTINDEIQYNFIDINFKNSGINVVNESGRKFLTGDICSFDIQVRTSHYEWKYNNIITYRFISAIDLNNLHLKPHLKLLDISGETSYYQYCNFEHITYYDDQRFTIRFHWFGSGSTFFISFRSFDNLSITDVKYGYDSTLPNTWQFKNIGDSIVLDYNIVEKKNFLTFLSILCSSLIKYINIL